jgi:DNA modification methylase
MLELRPIVVDENNIVLGGNMRLKACIEVGLKEVYIVKAEDLTEQQKDEFIVKDNVGFGEWDWDILANEWDTEKLQDWGLDLPLDLSVEELEAEEDDYEIPNEIETDIVLGDLFEIGEHRLLCGDSTDSDLIEKLLNGQKADLVFTDPPYGINVKMNNSKNFNLATSVQILGDKTTEVAVDAFNICSLMNIPMIFWGANHYAYDAKLPNAKCWITWDKQEKNNHIDQADCELAWTNINSPARIFHHLWAGFRRDSEKGEKRVHPTQKPVQLICEILQHFIKVKSNLILDLFLGSGSTMVACEQLKRKCYGMELDPKYCQVIIDRMKKLDPSLEIKRNGEIIRNK